MQHFEPESGKFIPFRALQKKSGTFPAMQRSCSHMTDESIEPVFQKFECRLPVFQNTGESNYDQPFQSVPVAP